MTVGMLTCVIGNCLLINVCLTVEETVGMLVGMQLYKHIFSAPKRTHLQQHPHKHCTSHLNVHTQVDMLRPKVFGSYHEFGNRYCTKPGEAASLPNSPQVPVSMM